MLEETKMNRGDPDLRAGDSVLTPLLRPLFDAMRFCVKLEQHGDELRPVWGFGSDRPSLLPPPAAIDVVSGYLNALITEPASRAEVEQLVGIMLARFKRAPSPADIAGYVCVLTGETKAISPECLAIAIRQLWRKGSTAPTPSELLDSCRTERQFFVKLRGRIIRARRFRLGLALGIEMNDPVVVS
jgi:hypothetical protein